MKTLTKGKRGLAWVLSAAMTVTLVPTVAFAADESQDAPKWKDGTYQSTAKGYDQGDVTVEIVIENGKIISATSPVHNLQTFWDVMHVDKMLEDIVTYQKADVDIVTGATYSSNAVLQAAGKALESAKVEDSSEEPAEAHYAQVALYDSNFLSYASKTVYDNTFVDPSVTYTIDEKGDYVFKLTLRPAENVQINKWDPRTFNLNGQDITGIRYAAPYSYQSKVMTEIGSDEIKGTKTFRFVIPGEEVSYLSQVAFQLTFDTTTEKQSELGSTWPLSTYMGIDLTKDEAPSSFVLMNIPYAEFYKAELGETGTVDAISAATLKYGNEGVAGGSYHEIDATAENEASVKANGVIFPVLVKDLSVLDAAKQVSDETTKTISLVTGREKTITETEVKGQDALFCADSYSWYKLSEKPARYKTMEAGEDGAFNFSAVNGRSSSVEVAEENIRTSYHTHHGNFVEISLGTIEGVSDADTVNGVVVTLDDGSQMALPHVQEIWSKTQIGWADSSVIGGKTITNVLFITKTSVVDCPVNIAVLPEYQGEITAAFNGEGTSVTLTGLPEDLENAKATVGVTENRQTTYINTEAEKGNAIENNAVAVSNPVDGTEYTVTVTSDNYAPMTATATYTKPASGGTPSGSGGPVTPSYKVAVPAQTSSGSVSASLEKAKKGDTVTITVTPEEGYQADAVVIKDKDGNEIEVKDNGDGTFSFTMPASEVSIEASFKEKSEEPAPAPHENCPSEPFTDVDTSLWYHEGIDYAIEHGMMNGVADDLFAPDDTTTRAMIVTILYRLEGEPAAEAASFKDVESGSWYEAAVNWAAAKGIVNGYDADTFAPTDPITREQMAAILYRYANFKGQDVSGLADLGGFTDSSAVSDYAQTAMAWAVNAGLSNGTTETTLVPQGNATRAQVATLMMRLCENVMK